MGVILTLGNASSPGEELEEELEEGKLEDTGKTVSYFKWKITLSLSKKWYLLW